MYVFLFFVRTGNITRTTKTKGKKELSFLSIRIFRSRLFRFFFGFFSLLFHSFSQFRRVCVSSGDFLVEFVLSIYLQ